MQDKAVEDSLRDLVSSLQLAKIYPLEHPKFKASVEAAISSLRELLRQRKELVIGIVEDELAFENEIYLDLSKNLRPIIQYLKDRGVQRISFRPGVSREELIGFIELMIVPAQELTPDAQGYLERKRIKNISVGKLKTASGVSEALGKSVDYLSRYEESLSRISGSLNNIMSGRELKKGDLRQTVADVMEQFAAGYNNLFKLSVLKKHDLGTFVHMLNASILSMHFSSKLGYSKDDVLNIGIAALFHDIGKIYISQRLIKKKEKLTEDEFSSVKSHTILGSQILLRYADELGILPAVVCFEHHLRYDMKGYPKLDFAVKQHPFSAIISICDVYDALNERRSYKKAYPPQIIYRIMLKESGRIFEPEFLDKFFSIIGVWPAGTIIRLSDARIAIVREQNEDDIFSPKVEIVLPLDQREMVDLSRMEPKLKIEESLDPCQEGRRFFHLI